MTFYKATRPSGESFAASPDGTRPVYEVGFTYSLPKNERRAQLCSSGVLHASDVASETLIGGKWPCRLFEIEGKPVVGPQRHKFGFYAFDVVREIEAWRALGPNGLEVSAFIEAVHGTNAEQQRGVAAAWDAAWAAAWAAARAAARAAAWDAARAAAWDAAWDAARDAARDSARAAVLALCVRDLITPNQFDLLYHSCSTIIAADDLGPWDTLKARRLV